MSYHLKVIRDYPIGFWKLDESSGSTAFDNSGCANNGTYFGGLDSSILPLVPGGASGNLINNSKYIALPTTKDYYASTASGGLGDLDTSDNDFTIEIWVYQNITTTNRTVIFADEAAGIGLFYENGNVIFKVQGNEVSYTLSNNNKVIYLTGVYAVSSIKLFVDGTEVASKSISGFKFSNSSLSLSVGPTESASDYFIADAPAVYRYSLPSNKINDHYLSGIISVSPYQIVNAKGGYFFPAHEEDLHKVFTYEFETEKMKSFVDEDLFYDANLRFLSFYITETAEEKESFFYDILNVPSSLGITSSKIEWLADKGITVFVSQDGTSYQECTNGSYMPYYSKSDTITGGPIYIKVRMYSSDASKYLPRFSKFKIKFYADKKVYAQNYGYKIESDYEYDVTSFNLPPLLRFKKDGITTNANHGFKINASNIRTIEFLFRPSAVTATTLLSGPGLNLSWNGSGTISKTGIDEFYVNGVSKTSTSSIGSVFASDMLYLVTVVTALPVSGDIVFNSSGPSNSYNNIALYESNFSTAEIVDNYNSYISRPALSTALSSFQVTDSGSEYYDDEYVVIRSI